MNVRLFMMLFSGIFTLEILLIGLFIILLGAP